MKMVLGLLLCVFALQTKCAERQWQEMNRQAEQARAHFLKVQQEQQLAAQRHMAEQSRMLAENMRRHQEQEYQRAQLALMNRK